MTSWKGYAMVFGAFLVHLTLGTLYTFGNMSPYIASYYKYVQGQSINPADLTWVYSAMIAAQGLLMTMGGILERRLGPRITAFLGCSIMSSGVLLTHFTVKYDFIWIVMTYGVMYGIGISFSYISLISCGMKWFPKQRGLVSGIIVAGFGLGALVFNPIQTEFLNHENVLPNRQGFFFENTLLQRIPNVFLLLGGIYYSMQIIGCLLASSPPIDHTEAEVSPVLKEGLEKCESHLESGGNNNLQINAASNLEVKPIVNYTPLQFLKTREFYLLWLTFFFNAQTSNFMNAMYKIYGQSFIRDDLFLAIVGAIGAAFNAMGRIGWGFLIDTYCYKTCMRMMLVLALILLLTMPATQLLGRYCFAAWMCSIQVVSSGSFVIFPAFVSKLFGPEYGGTNYGLVFTQMVIGGPITSVLASTLIEVIGFTGMFYLLAGFTVFSIILTIPFREKLYNSEKKVKKPTLSTKNNRK